MQPWQMLLAKVNSVRSELPSGIEDPTISSINRWFGDYVY